MVNNKHAQESKKTLIITGASGFLGKHLCQYFLEKNFNVVGLSRSELLFPKFKQHYTWSFFDLEQGIDASLSANAAWFKGATLVHAAYSTLETNPARLRKINLEGSKKLFNQAKAMGVEKTVFISSLSAHAEAESFYGKCKLALEQELSPKDVAARLGLVLGNGGLYSRLKQSIQKNAVVPLFYGGRQQVQTLWVQDACKAIEVLIHRGLYGVFKVAHPEPVLLKVLYEKTAVSVGKKPIFLPLPGYLFFLFLRFMERLGITLPVNSENLLGLKKMQVFSVEEDLAKLGLQPLGLSQTLRALEDES